MTDAKLIDPVPRKESGYRAEYRVNLPENAFFFYSTTNGMGLREELAPIRAASAFESEYTSDDVIIIGDSEKSCYILAGALTAFRSLTHFSAVRHANKFYAINVWQPEIRKGETPERVLLLTGDDWRTLLVQYAEEVRKANNLPELPPAPHVTGYCSWYYYYENLPQKDFLRNLEILKSAGNGSKPLVRIMQIDDGYQPYQGDWLERCEQWPDSMESVAARISDAGMVPGIWFMPFVASTASRVYRGHPDWFVRQADGAPALVQGWSPAPNHIWGFLDMTNDEVRNHIRNVCRTFYAWGFRYFKLDGLSYGLYPGKYHDPSATAVSAFRLGMKCIREALPDATILACSPVYLACLGYADHCRCGNDTKAEWPMMSSAVHASLSRWWFFDRWFRADPDVLIVRHDRSALTPGERRISALSAILSGVAFTSDCYDLLSENERTLLNLGLELHMTGLFPQKWDYRKWDIIFTGTLNGRRALAVINDTQEEMEVDFSEFGFHSALSELLHPRGLCSGTVRIPPHDAMLFSEEETGN
ncbi:MAG: alpha-galactosidase [Victivallales bacterium]|nr:alpha-galactosidase [Victivallales bacterium]